MLFLEKLRTLKTKNYNKSSDMQDLQNRINELEGQVNALKNEIKLFIDKINKAKNLKEAFASSKKIILSYACKTYLNDIDSQLCQKLAVL